MNKNNAEYILRILEAEGITHFFMVPGKLINPFMSCYNKIEYETYCIQPVVAAHEGGAAAMADGYARASGNFGVCMAIDGPGAVNAIPFLASAQADNSSVLLIVGQIPRDFQMCGAIQDTTQSGINTVDMLKPVCQVSFNITHAHTIDRYLKATLKAMIGPNKGSAFISISKDVLLEDQCTTIQKVIKSYDAVKYLDKDATTHFIQNYLFKAKKIAIIVGSRSKSEGFYLTLKRFSEKYAIPVATTISSKSLFDEDHENFLGIFGYSGHKRAIDTLLSDSIDLVLLLGFDVTQWTTLAWHENFLNQKAIVQIDKDQQYINKYMEVHYGVVANEEVFLNELDHSASKILEAFVSYRQNWINELGNISLYESEKMTEGSVDKIHPSYIVKTARSIFEKNTIAVADAGVHRSYATHYWKTYVYNSYFAATTFAPMGWAVPASIGIAIAKPKQNVVVFTGDGCMLMSGLEIQTAVKLNLDITYIVFNNSCYGASHFNNLENIPSLTQIPQHNWAMLGESIGAKGFRVRDPKMLEETIACSRQFKGPKVIDILCAHDAKAPSAMYSQTLNKHKFM